MAKVTRILPSGGRTQVAVYLLAALLFMLAGIAMTLTPGWYVVAPTGVTIPWWALLAGFAAAQLMAFNIEMRDQSHLVTFTELPLVIGLVFQSPMIVLMSRVVGSLVVLAIVNRATFTKLVFNAANLSLDAAVALAIYRGIVGVDVPTTAFHWFGLGLAVFVANFLTTLSVSAVIAINVGSTRQLLTGSMLRIQAMVVLAMTALGILIAQSALSFPVLAVGLLSVFLVAYMGVRQYTTLTIRHSRLLAIQEFSRNLGQRLGLEVLAGEILVQARSALTAGSASFLVLEGGDAFDAKAYQLSDSGTATRMLLPQIPDQWRSLNTTAGPILFECSTAPDFQESFKGRVLVAPIEAGSLRALLVVENREGQLRSFDDSDVQLISALATHADSVFDNGLLLHSLGELAVTDSLTGLPNKRHLDERIQAEVSRFHGDQNFSLVLIDLNDFKEVNDTLGHAVGDQLLQIVGTRFDQACPDGGFVARIGGDEFAMLLPDTGHDETVVVVQEISELLGQPVALGAMSLSVRASAGIAVAPEDGLTPDLLLRHADVAMYSAKRDQAPWRRYNPAVDTHSPRRLSIAAQLPEAIASGSLRLEYQPKMHVNDRSINSVEALARWEHPEFGEIPPTEFISVAEQAGVIHQLTEFVLNTALAQAREWRDLGIDLRIAVNLSVRDVVGGDLVELVTGLLATHGLPASCLTLELTETILLPVNSDALGVLEDLRALGIRIALDDFGTGYSSMGYLRHLPVDEIKIDKSFIMDLPLRKRDQLIVRAIVDLGHHLGLEVTAEGVESQHCLGLVGELGCDQAQGFLLSRSLAPDDLLRWLSDDDQQANEVVWPKVLHLPERHLRLA